MIKIRRLYENKQTLGILGIEQDGKLVFTCCTLELPWKDNQRSISCIPRGTYKVKKRGPLDHRNYVHFIIQDVPNRSYILIHTANYSSQIAGCIIVGDRHTDINHDGLLDVANSTVTLKKMVDILPDEFELEIE